MFQTPFLMFDRIRRSTTWQMVQTEYGSDSRYYRKTLDSCDALLYSVLF